ncbi:MAG: amino acid adenylation domain-containing protein, partial [Bacteroidota bacterium]
FGDIRLTYEEVNERAQAMAMVLMEEWDIGVGSVVAIHLERSENLICVLLAILKTGACYLPMDLYAPEMRKKMIVEDATPDLIITDGRVSWAGERPVFTWQDLRDQIVSADRANHKLPLVKPESLAYIIYTSGTTGKPKGVCIQHKGLNNYVHWFNHAFNIQTTDQTLLLSSIAYDLCYSSLWTAIVAGGTLHVLSENQSLDAEQCVDTIRQWPITYLKMTPSHLKVLLQDGEFLNVLKKSSVKMILLGGERIDTGDVEVLMKVNPNIRIVNHYGPTETTIGTIAHEFGAVDLESFCKGPVIGKPIYNAKAFVLDSALNPVPIGQPGELYISGDGLAQGYFRSPTLTAERFIQHPQYGERLYKTGDMVKLLPDQTMSYLGRVDHQIKVRGNRVELEEIESVFNNFTSVVKCVVKYEKRERSDDHVIVAYLKVNDLFKETELVAHATQYLPAYMMPDLLITLREFPLNANGKVDRNALSHIGNESAPEKRGLTLPETETEKRLVDIWKDVLMRDKIGIDDSFFDAGGHSLLAAKLIARIHTGLKVKISLKNIFDMLTIRKLAAFIDRQAKEMSTAIKPVKQQVYYDVSPAQRQIWTLSQLSDDSSVFNMPKAYVLEGRIDRELFAKAIDAVCQRHESLRTTFIEVNHEPKQVIHEMGALPEVLTLHDMSASADTGEQIAVLLKKDSHSPFDLVRGPLFRATLVKAKNDLHVFIYNMHLIISDAWSKEIIWKEVMLWYNALLQNKPSPLAPLEIQYKDYVYWLKANDHNIANDRSYWLNLFEEAPEPLELPTDYDRPKIKTTNGDANGFGLGVDLSMKVADFAKSSHVSLFTVLMTGLKVLLLRCTNQNDIVVGTPVSGRSHEQLHDQVGLYLNNLAIRTKLDQKATFLETLEECKKNILNAFEHQAYPFDLLLQEINFKRDFSRSPLYDVVAVLGSHDFSGEVKATTDIPGVNPKSLRTGFRKSIVDLRFVFVESERQGITFLVEYNKDLYKESTITQLGNKFIMLMDTVMTSPLMRLDEIPFDLPGEALAAPGEAVEETFNFSF